MITPSSRAPQYAVARTDANPIAALDEIGRNREVRAVILAAAVKYLLGHDLGQMTGRDINEYRRIFDVCSELMQKCNRFRSR